VAYYINQFFAGLGSEEANDTPLQVKEGPVGPGRALQQALGEQGSVVSTIFAGDDFFISNQEDAVSQVAAAPREIKPDLLLAGPAFDAGRYGLACALVCKTAWDMGIPAVTGMHPDNAGMSAYRQDVLAMPTGETPVEMAANLKSMLGLGLKLVRKEPLGPADAEGFLPTGIRRLHQREKLGGRRAVDMVLDRVLGRPFVSEIPAWPYDMVDPPDPVLDLRGVTLGLVTSAGIVPRGNPDQQSSAIPRKVMSYKIAGLDALVVDDWESVHGGFKGYIYNTVNPNYAMPLPAVRVAEAKGLVKAVYPKVFSVVGAGCPVSDAKRMGGEIARQFKKDGVQAAIIAST
jgi:glycine reductase